MTAILQHQTLLGLREAVERTETSALHLRVLSGLHCKRSAKQIQCLHSPFISDGSPTAHPCNPRHTDTVTTHVSDQQLSRPRLVPESTPSRPKVNSWAKRETAGSPCYLSYSILGGCKHPYSSSSVMCFADPITYTELDHPDLSCWYHLCRK